jgi:hypothetical protein
MLGSEASAKLCAPEQLPGSETELADFPGTQGFRMQQKQKKNKPP